MHLFNSLNYVKARRLQLIQYLNAAKEAILQDLWHISAGGRVEKVIRSEFQAGTSASVSAFVVQILHGFDHLRSILVRGELKFNSG